MTHDIAAAPPVGTSNRADVPDVQDRLQAGTHTTKGALMSHEPWYAFIDGPRAADGERIGFSAAKPAVAWIVITLVLSGGLIAGIVVGVIALSGDASVLGFLVPLVVVGGPIAAASFIACLHTTRDLFVILGSQRR